MGTGTVVICLLVFVHVLRAESDLPSGDFRRCRAAYQDVQAFRLDVLPGAGWDNLRNIRTRDIIVSSNYSQCRTTGDGKYLIPDNINAIPMKVSALDEFAEFIGHYSNYTRLVPFTLICY